MRSQVMEVLQAHFKPEFLNRVDDIIIFTPLSEAQMEPIVDLQLARLRALLAERQIHLELAPAARQLIIRQGYDPQYGARPLKRALQRLVQNPLATAVLKGDIRPGAIMVAEVAPNGEELRFQPRVETQPVRVA